MTLLHLWCIYISAWHVTSLTRVFVVRGDPPPTESLQNVWPEASHGQEVDEGIVDDAPFGEERGHNGDSDRHIWPAQHVAESDCRVGGPG